ncbi:MAG: type II toxin-antitoxin system HicA family toxin [Lentisphaerae bacterium]|nr:type II toxin-antitoxin system HicA family toxin [Lentisphaerota bacterium]
MKRSDLISRLETMGCVLLRHGGRHDIYHNPETGNSEPVPRHREINEMLARRILRRLSVESGP